jgi:hypothetical protein
MSELKDPAALALLLLAHFGKEGTAELMIPQISQETLAEMIGTTRSQVNGFLNTSRWTAILRLCIQAHFRLQFCQPILRTRGL